MNTRKIPLYRQKGFHLFLLILPFVILVLVLNYFPLYHWKNVFYSYKPGLAMTSDRFVGLANFRGLFTNAYQVEELLRVLRNTFALSGLNVLALPLPMIFAILMSELRSKRFRKTVQTLTAIPNFISWAMVYAVAYTIFSPGDGFLNRLLISLGLADRGIDFLASPNHVWLAQMAWYLWKSLGWSAIMYFASMAGIDTELYEAAEVDGAGRFARIRFITVPGLIPTLFVMFVLNISNFVNYGLEQPLVFQNVFNLKWIQTLDLYVYNQGIAGFSAVNALIVGVFKSVVSIALVFSANGLSKLVRNESVI
ncbi:MAG: ABC transporter permease subunit [Clostridiales bacterium]|nr:ABC transporter permease subunit [Clostridiales bacterium]